MSVRSGLRRWLLLWPVCIAAFGCGNSGGGGDGRGDAGRDASDAGDVRDQVPPDSTPAEASDAAGDAGHDMTIDLSDATPFDPDGGASDGGASDAGTADAEASEGGASDGGGANAACDGVCSFVTLPIYGERMTYDHARKRLYVTVGASFLGEVPKMYADSLVVVDAVTASVVTSIPVGRYPSGLAMSDDGSKFWVREYNTPSVYTITLGPPPSISAPVPSDMVPLTRETAPLFRLVPGPPGMYFGIGVANGLEVVTDVGGTITRKTTYGFFAANTNMLVYSNATLYSNWGEVVDVSIPDMPFPSGQFGFLGPLALRTANSLVMLSGDFQSSRSPAIRVLDCETITSVKVIPLPREIVTGVVQVQYLPDGGVAFIGSKADNRRYLFIARTPAVLP